MINWIQDKWLKWNCKSEREYTLRTYIREFESLRLVDETSGIFTLNNRVFRETGVENTLHLRSYFITWDKFSGIEVFPVPCPNGKSAMFAYDSYKKWTGEYGKLRKELLAHIIKELKKELKKELNNQ